MKRQSQWLSISAGGFHASVHPLDLVLDKPGGELLKARVSVGEDFVAELPGLKNEAGVELQLRDVDAEDRKAHGSSSLSGYTCGRPTLWMQALLRWERLRIASGLLVTSGVSGADLTHRLMMASD